MTDLLPRFMTPAGRSFAGRTGFGLLLALGISVWAAAQEGNVQPTAEAQAVPANATRPRPQQATPGRQPAEGAQPMPMGNDAKPGEKPGAKPGEKPGESKPADGTKPEDKGPVTRSDTPEEKPDPSELEVRPDEQGRVKFNFRGQPWPSVLDWLAEISQTSLDWQELPGDYLNLTTQRAYTVDEVRDLLNERLMTRGYTILQQQEGLVVTKLEGLNTARVPRVHPEDLRLRDDHEFVKVSFPLSWLLADEAVEELKPMLSPHGTMAALSTSNRLEVMDVVTNLRQIHHVLQEEQSSEVRSAKVHEFFLRYTRASDVLAQLETLLGIKKSGGGMEAMNPQMMQQMQQMQQQMMQQMQRGGQQNDAKQRSKPSEPGDVNLVINARQNSIIANAPPDKLVVIAEAVKMFDVPPQPGTAIGANFQRVKVFRLAQLDPKALASMLEQAGNLDPSTQLVADDKNRALIAYATPADQITIEALISKLDGSGRQFKVIRLRRLQADYVAGSIEFMMGQEEKEEDNSRRGGYFSFYGMGRPQEDTSKKDQFRVDADVINNRLLLWANEIELEAVENLLVQLGEIRAPGQADSRGRLRTLEVGSPESARELLQKLKDVWPEVSPAPLQIEMPEKPSQPIPEEKAEPKQSEPAPQNPEAKPENAVYHPSRIAVPVHLAAVFQASDSPENETPVTEAPAKPVDEAVAPELEQLSEEQLLQRYFPQQAAEKADAGSTAEQGDSPVVVRVDENGRITLASENPIVLDLLEDILHEITPAAKDWAVFELEHASAYWVAWNLEEFFEEKEEEEPSRRPWFWGPSEEPKDESLRLSQRKPLKFISDSDTNTIVVQNATSEQLETVRQLIELYDKPEPVTKDSARMNATYTVRYSRASLIAESIKDVFRDLLSSNDRALQPPQQQSERGRSGERPESPPPTRSSSNFGGKLSLGADDISNTLLISTEGEQLMKLVTDMVKRVDEAAKPVSTVRVVNLKTSIGGDKVRELLDRLLEERVDQNADPNARGNGNQPNQPNQPEGQPGNRNRSQRFQSQSAAEGRD